MTKADRRPPPRKMRAALLALALGFPGAAWAQENPVPTPAPAQPAVQAEPDNGTDPTRVRRTLTVDYKHLDLRNDFNSDEIEFIYSEPLGRHTALALTIPVPGVDVAGDSNLGLGDLELVLTHIPVVTRKYGIVIKAGAMFDTATRPELGNGQTVLEGTFIYARFLKGGSIFAPSFEFDYGVGREAGRAQVSSLTMDFYYVPHLKNQNYYMTVDPFILLDFEGDKQSGGLSVTLGRILGPALGGRAQAYLKPSIYLGGDRTGNWGIEAGVKLLGF